MQQDLERRDVEIRRLHTLLKVSKIMNSGITHDRMIEQINEAVRMHLTADRLTVFFYDPKTNELYSYIASGLQPGELRIPPDQGIAGYVFGSGEMVCVEDAYDDPRFSPEVDRKTGYRTKSMLTMHITNRQGVRIGVVQALNKKAENGVFSQEDMIFLWEAVDQISDLYTALEEALSHLLIFSVDTDAVLTYVSPAIEGFTGYRAGETLGKTIYELVHPEDLKYFTSRIAKILDGDNIEPVEFRIVTRQEEVKWMRATSRPLYEDDGVTGAQGQMVDITERKDLEEDLREAQKIESIGRLAGGIAHDFNNLLVPIIGYTDVAAGKLEDAHPATSHLFQIKDAAERAKALTHQLLAFGRKQMLDMQVLDLNAVYWDFEKILRRLIGEDIEIIHKLDEGIDKVRADRSQVQQILMNLAVNARDAMPGGGTLLIETANVELDDEFAARYESVSAGPHVMISVTDTGHGMDQETLKQVFEPFFTTKGRGKGAGLGLATVYGIVKQHNSSIWATSEPNEGTSFKIYFPRVDAPDEAVEEVVAAVAPPEDNSGNEMVLVVEDEDVVRGFVCEVLMDGGYDVLETGVVDDAIRFVEEDKKPIQLLITDVIMPRMNGRELSERISAIRPDLKVLFMSGYTDNVIGEHGVLNEGMNFIQKPFTMQEFTHKVRMVLDGEVEDPPEEDEPA